MGWLNSYNEEYHELLCHLTKEWGMKPRYAQAFLSSYKKSIGKILSRVKERSSLLLEGDNPEMRLFAVAYIDYHDLAIFGQAHRAYLNDLRSGKHVGTSVEKAIWAILANRSDLLEDIDQPLSKYVEESYEDMFPDLLAEAFVN